MEEINDFSYHIFSQLAHNLLWSTISLMTQGHWIGNRIWPVFIGWAHSDQRDPRPSCLSFFYYWNQF